MRLPSSDTLPLAAEDGPVALEPRSFTHRAFLAQTQVGSESCRFFVPGPSGPPPHTAVVVRFSFAGEPELREVQATVLRCEDPRTSSRTGLLVEVKGAELERFGRIYAHARGVSEALGRRSAERTGVSLAAELLVEGQPKLHATVRDLSRGGAFVALEGSRPAVDAQVTLVIHAGWVRRLRLGARVVWVGTRHGEAGVALAFGGNEREVQHALMGLLARTGEPRHAT